MVKKRRPPLPAQHWGALKPLAKCTARKVPSYGVSGAKASWDDARRSCECVAKMQPMGDLPAVQTQ
jgi:hypothetical protein